MIYNVVLVSAVKQSESAIRRHISENGEELKLPCITDGSIKIHPVRKTDWLLLINLELYHIRKKIKVYIKQ